ncbi:MAG: HAMP domain-containing sensor histidine kinase [Limnobacter sp.]|nr:HAMP domain-containing sensor histidine kinase [Limnobacter sp.]
MSAQLHDRRHKACALIAAILLIEMIHSRSVVSEHSYLFPDAHNFEWIGRLSIEAIGLGLVSYTLFFAYGVARQLGDSSKSGMALALVIGVVGTVVTLTGQNWVVSVVGSALQVFSFHMIFSAAKNPFRLERGLSYITAVLYSISFMAASGTIHLADDAVLEGVFMATGGVLIVVLLFNLFLQDMIHTLLGSDPKPEFSLQSAIIKLAHDLKSNIKNFSHDVRQPLSTINIVSSVGKALASSPDQSQRFEHLQSSQRALGKLIDQFLASVDGAVIQSLKGKVPNFTEFRVDQILQPLVEEYRHLAVSKGLELRYFPSELQITSDFESLEKIIRNGLDNAIKYTKEGGVLVGVRMCSNGGARITVTDTGSGVDNDKVANKDKGWGYGSTIVKELSKKIGVQTQVKNRTGSAQGSVFEVLLQASALTVRESKSHASKDMRFILASCPKHKADIQQLSLNVSEHQVIHTPINTYLMLWETINLNKVSSYFFYLGHQEDVDKTAKVISELEILTSKQCCVMLVFAPQFDPEILPPNLLGYATLKTTRSPDGNLLVNGLKELLELIPCTEEVKNRSKFQARNDKKLQNRNQRNSIAVN